MHTTSHHVIDAHYENSASLLRHYQNSDGSPVLQVEVLVKNDNGYYRCVSGLPVNDDEAARHRKESGLGAGEDIYEFISFRSYDMLPGFARVRPNSKLDAYGNSRYLGKVDFTGQQQLLSIDNFKKDDAIKSYWLEDCYLPTLSTLNDRPILCWPDTYVLNAAFHMPYSWQSQNRDKRLRDFIALQEMFKDHAVVNERLGSIIAFLFKDVEYGNAYQRTWREYMRWSRDRDEKTIKKNLPRLVDLWAKLVAQAEEFERVCAPLAFKDELERYNCHERYVGNEK